MRILTQNKRSLPTIDSEIIFDLSINYLTDNNDSWNHITANQL